MTTANSQEIDQEQDLSSAQAKGERVKRLRNMANLSRDEFCADGETNIATLISWEVGRYGGLSAKGANRVIARVAKAGVVCPVEWLLNGTGVGPEIRTEQDAIDFVIQDDAMSPQYQLGDYVSGTKRYKKNIKSLLTWDCIVQTIDGRILMRNLQPGSKDNLFHLISTNLKTTAKDAFVFDVELAVAAPVIWHKRKEPPNIEEI